MCSIIRQHVLLGGIYVAIFNNLKVTKCCASSSGYDRTATYLYLCLYKPYIIRLYTLQASTMDTRTVDDLLALVGKNVESGFGELCPVTSRGNTALNPIEGQLVTEIVSGI